MKRGQTGICALVAVDKPAGCSSHDVVSAVRRATGERRVGHAGTLDPFATGLLIVGIGPATRLSNFVMDDFKEYAARIAFGCSTQTDDLSGEIAGDGLAELSTDDLCRLADPEFARSVLDGFLGTQMQMPPAYSAKKIAGKKAYELAREGTEVELAATEVVVRAAELLHCGSGDASELDGSHSASVWSGECSHGGLDVGFSDERMAGLPWWDVRFDVSKGTYIRALARDIGREVGCGAFLSRLRRLSLGSIGVADAVPFDDVEKLGDPDYLQSMSLDPCKVLGLSKHECTEEEIARIGNGAPLKVTLNQIESFGENDPVGIPAQICMVSSGRMLAVYEAERTDEAQRSARAEHEKSRRVHGRGVSERRLLAEGQPEPLRYTPTAHPSGSSAKTQAIRYKSKLVIPGGAIGVE